MRWFKKPEAGQKSKDELHGYWRNPDKMNDPATYLESGKRSEYLVSLVKQHASADASIIELGCNVGRNLHYLWEAGYRNLSGVEINEQAIKLMRERFPDMQPTIYQGALEDRVKDLGRYDLVFTMAVLEHIHRDSEWVFKEMARITQKCLITIEDEKNVSERHFPRNYRQIFESLGMRQVYEHNCADVPELSKKFYARVFVK